MEREEKDTAALQRNEGKKEDLSAGPVANPNPRANENISDRESEQPASGVGSEITDGEDA